MSAATAAGLGVPSLTTTTRAGSNRETSTGLSLVRPVAAIVTVTAARRSVRASSASSVNRYDSGGPPSPAGRRPVVPGQGCR